MSELLQLVLTDASARDGSELPALASDMASKFVPWNDIADV
jgi:hypothetical protein